MYNIHLLPASFGDSILIEYGTTSIKYILIDGGPYFAYKDVLKDIKRIAPNLKELELLVVTHVDIDHIDGIVVMLNQPALPFTIKEIWFNGLQQMQFKDDLLGALQGEYLSGLIHKLNLPHNTHFKGKAVMIQDKPLDIKLDGGMKITLLHPNKKGLELMAADWEKEMVDFKDEATVMKRLQTEHRYDEIKDDLLGELNIEELQAFTSTGDKSVANGSSIAFLASFNNKTCLFAGDAFSDYLIPAIQQVLTETGQSKLKIDAWKLAHHGSKKSTIDELMQLIETDIFLISSDGKHFKHPDAQTIAKLIKYGGPNLSFYFNYKTSFNDIWDDAALQTKYSFKTFYPKEGAGICIALTPSVNSTG